MDEKQRLNKLLDDIRHLYSFKDYAGAIKALMAEPHENSAEYWYFLGNAHRKLGNRTDAEWCCKKALQISPTDRRAKFELALLYQADGNYNEAIRLLEEAASPEDGEVDFEQQVDILNSLALTYKKNNNFAKALEIYKITENELYRVASLRAHKLWQKDHPGTEPSTEELLELVTKLLQRDLFYCTVVNNQGTLYAEMGNKESARSAFNRSIRFTPTFLEYTDPVEGLQLLDEKEP